MSFLSKPNWYGVPVLVRANTRPLLRLLAIVLGFAVLASIIAAGMAWDSPDSRILVPIQALVLTVTIIVFAIGWFVAVFFWFRAFVNIIQTLRHRSDSFKYWRIKLLYDPFYGWRADDLSVNGLRYRRLVIEGLIGFVAVTGLVWLLVIASKAVGIDLDTG